MSNPSILKQSNGQYSTLTLLKCVKCKSLENHIGNYLFHRGNRLLTTAPQASAIGFIRFPFSLRRTPGGLLAHASTAEGQRASQKIHMQADPDTG